MASELSLDLERTFQHSVDCPFAVIRRGSDVETHYVVFWKERTIDREWILGREWGSGLMETALVQVWLAALLELRRLPDPIKCLLDFHG